MFAPGFNVVLICSLLVKTIALWLSLEPFWTCVADARAGLLLRRRYDTSKLTSPEGRELVAQALQYVEAVPWSVDVNAHAAWIEQASHDVLREHFSVRTDGPRSSYISDKVWQVRARRNHLKAVTRFWKEGHRIALLKEGFARLADRRGSGWWVKVDLFHSAFAAAVRFSVGWIKEQIRADKQVILKRIAEGKVGLSVHAIQKARLLFSLAVMANPFLPGKNWISVGWNILDRWMEAGCLVSMQRFEQLVSDFRVNHDVTIDLSLIPYFLDVELQFRKVRCGAAAGLDGLPPELFKAAPQVMARMFHPPMVKAALRIAQPIQWRGGILFEAFKHNGPPSLADNYRSLFVSSIPGKCYRCILRDKAAGVIENTLGTLRCGGRKRRP